MRRGRVLVALTFGTALGCNALLGLSDPVDEPSSGDGSFEDARDSSAGGDGSDQLDACTNEGGTQSDRHNCGACGHDCQGGDCIGGACQPLQLASGGGRISSILVQDPVVYWSEVFPDGGGAVKVINPIDGGGGPTTLEPQAPGASSLRSFAGDVYFTTTNDMIELLAGGLPPTLAVLSISGCGMEGIAVDSNNVYFSCSKSGQVDAVLRTGGASAAPLFSAAGPGGATVVGGRVYWSSSGHIQSGPADGGTPDTIAPAIITNEPIFPSDGVNIFWIDQAEWIESSPLAGTAMPTVVGKSLEAVQLTIDSTNVYWTDNLGAGAIYRAPKAGEDGGAPFPIDARFLNLPGPIAVDGTSVYWGNQDGTLMKYALP